MGSEHGGINYSRLKAEGINPDDVLDFSVSINPYPLPAGVLSRLYGSSITRYPDSGCTLLRENIRNYNGLESTGQLLVVNGTSQGIYLIVHALLKKNDPVCIITPTYSEYYDACSLKTENIDFIEMTEAGDFYISTIKILSRLDAVKPRLLWLCSPNNPTGSYLKEKEFETLRQGCLRNGTIMILDEAYICFVPEKHRYNTLREGVIVLRSMTKDFSIPGLRLGYLMGDPALISSIERWQPEWSISAPAQDAGIAVFDEILSFKENWKRISRNCESLRNEMESMGLKTFPSRANFFMVKVPDAGALKKDLWKKLILVRDCASFQLKNIIRIGVGTEEANSLLIQSFKEHFKK